MHIIDAEYPAFWFWMKVTLIRTEHIGLFWNLERTRDLKMSLRKTFRTTTAHGSTSQRRKASFIYLHCVFIHSFIQINYITTVMMIIRWWRWWKRWWWWWRLWWWQWWWWWHDDDDYKLPMKLEGWKGSCRSITVVVFAPQPRNDPSTSWPGFYMWFLWRRLNVLYLPFLPTKTATVIMMIMTTSLRIFLYFSFITTHTSLLSSLRIWSVCRSSTAILAVVCPTRLMPFTNLVKVGGPSGHKMSLSTGILLLRCR